MNDKQEDGVDTPSILVLKNVFDCDTILKHNFDLFSIKRYLFKNDFFAGNSKMIYLYFYENIFQDNFIHMIFTFSNSIT
jgi:hypothetical protein